MPAIGIVADFISGILPSEDFLLKIAQDKELEEFLTQYAPPPYARHHVNTFYFIIESDFSNPYDLTGARQHLASILESLGVACEIDVSKDWILDLIAKVQPAWVDIPHAFITKIIEESKCANKAELASLIKEQIALDYVCLKKKPKWLQSPEWPYHNGRPMMFVAQNDLGDLYHDEACLYVFIDKEDGTTRCILQRC